MSGLAIVVFVVALVVAVLLHELGHLLTAKRFGMRAEQYFVGFGPTLWSTRRGETEYGLKAFPLGGFVRIVGMTPLDERLPPVVDELLTPEALAHDRARAARASGPGSDPAEQPNIPSTTWDRLARVLTDRGTPRELTQRILRRTRGMVSEHPTTGEFRRALHEVLVSELDPSDRVGDLNHRLLEGDRGRFFHDRPAWQRAVVLVTGPATHLLVAFFALFAVYLFLPTLQVAPVVAEVVPGSPAEEAGLEPGDRILGVGDLTSSRYTELQAEIRRRPGEPTTLTVEREDDAFRLELTPETREDEETGETFGMVGFRPAIEEVELGPLTALRRAAVGEPDPAGLSFGGVLPMVGLSIEGLVRIFSPEGLGDLLSQAVGQTERAADGAVSLVGAAAIAGQTGTDPFGISLFLALFASINVFFFIFNLVPLPPFDGGHLAVLAIERGVNLWRGLRGRRQDFEVDPRAVVAVTVPVLAVLSTVLIATLWLDITNPIRLG